MKQTGIFLFLILTILSCRVEEKIVDGQTAFDRKQFAKAATLLEKEYKKAKLMSERSKKAFLIGESYRIINKPESSKKWYMEAFNAGHGVEALKQYAFALKELEDYKEAIQAFKDVGGELGDPYEYQREIIACRQASTWAKNKAKSEYKIELPSFNSSTSDYYPVIYKEKDLIITSDRSASTGEDVYGWTGNNFSDLFIVEEKGSISSFSEVINSPYNEGTITFNRAFTEAYFSRCGDDSKDLIQYCKLMYTEKDGDTWTEPQVLDFIEDKVNYGHPSLSADGKKLYFSSDNPEGLGGFDIYLTTRNSEGWKDPKNLGSAINTEGNEVSPFIDQDTLYFASDFHVGMGGLDIFKTARRGNGWGPLQNLRAPINSGADEFGLVIDYRKKADAKVVKTGYYTSTRPNGKGNDDIYKFEKVILPPPPPPVEPVDSEVVVINNPIEEPVIVYELLLEGKVVEKVYTDPENPNSAYVGKGSLPDANVQIQYGDTTFTVKTDEKGEFKIALEEQTSYNFTGSKTRYLTKNKRFTTRGIERDPKNPKQTLYTEILLDKVFTNVEIRLEGIYYDYNKADIRPDARPVLNELASLLIRNPGINIELGSHTDCRGRDGYNKTLSQRRANSAVEYLVSKGIARNRMIAKGYGESQPSTTCACNSCSDDQHQQNRRTTFKIIEN